MTSCTGKVYANNQPKHILTVDFPIGSELQNWALHFSLPVLHEILPLVYFRHSSMVVAALHILSSDSISDDDFHIADTLLQGFYRKFPELYGKCKLKLGYKECILRHEVNDSCVTIALYYCVCIFQYQALKPHGALI